MHLLEEMLELLRAFTFGCLNLAQHFLDVGCVALNSYRLQMSQCLRFWHSLQGVCKHNQILERTTKELCILFVLSTHAVKIIFDLRLQRSFIEARCIKVRFNRTVEHLNE